MTTVGVVGGLSVDHLVCSPVGARFDCLGGPGLYAALGARLIAGTSVRLLADLPVSTPAFARVLGDAGVDLTHCGTTPDVPRVWILTSALGRRIVPLAAPPGSEFSIADDLGPVPPPIPGGLDGLFYSSPVSVVPSPVLTGVDPEQRLVQRRALAYWESIAPASGVLLPSRVQLGEQPRVTARELARHLGIPVVARLDVEGMYAVDPAGPQWSITDDRAAVVDATGAGDTSAAAIVAALAQGADLPTAAAYGVSAARLVLAGWGCDTLLTAPVLTAPLDGVRTQGIR